ncbi:MAG: prepilin-type N-terminal cleavage/methylation domain-containing protein [Chthonomonas sp.]|nr:prepilin-type N-terminal cleavage/methylation domain-containing protein [Chthonomonas sp.]
MRTRAFTLLELLTVIAIIAVLAAIITPVYSRTKVSANRSSDLSNMNSLRSALQVYRVDQGGYPPALLGYVTLYEGTSNVIPANQLRTYLYPKRVESIDTFRPVPLRAAQTDITSAVWPNADSRAVGTAPQIDLNGDNKVDNTDDVVGSRQAFGPTRTVTSIPLDAASTPLQFYRVSGYDVALTRNGSGGTRTELRYALFWTQQGLGTGSANDDPRQLGYSDPPEGTVITWNSFYREYGSTGLPERAKLDVVLFLGGGAKPFDSREVFDRSWRIMP